MWKEVKRYLALFLSVFMVIANTPSVHAASIQETSVPETNDLQENKQVLTSYLPEFQNLKEGTDYASNQVVFLADSREEAEQVAVSYNATLRSFEYGVGVLLINEGESVYDTMLMSTNPNNQLPVVWPNYVSKPAFEVSKNSIELDPYMINNPNHPIDSYQWHHETIGTTYAWEAGYMGQGIDVAVLDTGINEHNGLDIKTSRAFIWGDVVSGNEVSDNEYAPTTKDVLGHGTYVAGMIAEKLDGELGAGVAPKVNLHNVKVIGDEGYGLSSDIMAGINYAVDELGVDIINMSFTTPSYFPLYEEVVQDAVQKGTVFVVSAGNENSEAKLYPAGFQNVICVAATTMHNTIANFSNFGYWVDVAAPGDQINSTLGLSNNSYGQHVIPTKVAFVDQGFEVSFGEYLSGTSLSSAIVTGEVAVLLSAKENIPELKDKQGAELVLAVETLLKKSVIPVKGTKIGTGIPTLPKLLNIRTLSEAPKEPVFSLNSGVYNDASISVTMKVDNGTSVYYSLDGKAPIYTDGNISPNAVLYTDAITIQGAKKVTLNAIAVNSNGISSKVSKAIYQLKPMISSVSLNGFDRLVVGNVMKVKASIVPSYAANQVLKYSVAPAKQGVTIDQTGLLKTIKTALPGNYVVTVATTDGSNIVVTKNVQIVKAAIVKTIEFKSKQYNEVRVDTDFEKNFAQELKIADGLGNSISTNNIIWTSSNEMVAMIDNTGKATIVGPGTTVIKATAKDGSLKSATTKLVVKQASRTIDIVFDDISGNNFYLALGTSKKLKTTINKELPKATNQTLTYEIVPSNQGVSITTDGVVIAKANATPGFYVINMSAKDGYGLDASMSITVLPSKMEKLSLSANTTKIFRVKSTILNYSGYTPTSMGVEVQMKSRVNYSEELLPIQIKNSNDKILSVNQEVDENGNLTLWLQSTGKGIGEAKITVMATDGSNLQKTIRVKVINPISKIIVSEETGSGEYLAKGAKRQLVATIQEAYGKVDTQKVRWYSSDPDIMSVDQKGVVTSKSYREGAFIFAVAQDGSYLENGYDCYIEGAFPMKDFEFTTLSNKIPVNYIGYGFSEMGGYKIGFMTPNYDLKKLDDVGHDNVTLYDKVVWYCSNPDIVTITYNPSIGYIIMPRKKGKCSITAKAMDGSKCSNTYQLVIY